MVSKEVDHAIRDLCGMVDIDNIMTVGHKVDIIINHYRKYYLRKIKKLESEIKRLEQVPRSVGFCEDL